MRKRQEEKKLRKEREIKAEIDQIAKEKAGVVDELLERL
jgi:hypothetical protein